MTSVKRIALAYNNVYSFEHRGGTFLVDTGPDYRGAFSTIQEALGGVRPDFVVATHAHLDHAGLGAQWQGQGTPVALSATDAPTVAAPSLDRDADMQAFEGYVNGCGAPAEVTQTALRSLSERRAAARLAATSQEYPGSGRGSRWPTALRYAPFRPAQTVGEGLLEGTAVRVLLSPGHTPGNLVLYNEDDGTLFSGDQLLPDITPTPAIQFTNDDAGHAVRFPSLPAFVASLRRLRELPLRRCMPGHGEPFEEVHRCIDENLAVIAQRSDKILRQLTGGAPATVYALADALYPRALKRAFWQIVATTQGHLDLLMEEGRAAVDGNVYRSSEG